MKLKKIAGLMMTCVMAVSCLAVSASAAELEEQAMSIEGSENVYVVGGVATLRSEEIGSIDDLLPIEEGIMPLAKGELSAGKGYTYGSVSISAGQKITISGSYTPTNAKLQVGYVNSSGTVTYVINQEALRLSGVFNTPIPVLPPERDKALDKVKEPPRTSRSLEREER